jgi:hypothetical protein
MKLKRIPNENLFQSLLLKRFSTKAIDIFKIKSINVFLTNIPLSEEAGHFSQQ